VVYDTRWTDMIYDIIYYFLIDFCLPLNNIDWKVYLKSRFIGEKKNPPLSHLESWNRKIRSVYCRNHARVCERNQKLTSLNLCNLFVIEWDSRGCYTYFFPSVEKLLLESLSRVRLFDRVFDYPSDCLNDRSRGEWKPRKNKPTIANGPSSPPLRSPPLAKLINNNNSNNNNRYCGVCWRYFFASSCFYNETRVLLYYIASVQACQFSRSCSSIIIVITWKSHPRLFRCTLLATNNVKQNEKCAQVVLYSIIIMPVRFYGTRFGYGPGRW